MATIFKDFQAAGRFCLQQILQVEILLGDQAQNMLAWALTRFNGGGGPIE
jgi:hypothetical protein